MKITIEHGSFEKAKLAAVNIWDLMDTRNYFMISTNVKKEDEKTLITLTFKEVVDG